MKLPHWIAAIGGLELLLGLWGIYFVVSVALGGQVRALATVALLAFIFALALGSVWAGFRLLRRDRRAFVPMLWILSAQSVRIVVPGLAWLVTLGWAFDLVLASDPASKIDSQQVLILVGAHQLPSYFAVNLLALAPLLAMLVWQRVAQVAATRATDNAGAT